MRENPLSSFVSHLSSFPRGHGVKRFSRAYKLILAASLGWFVILGCHTTDLIARVNPTATATAAPTVRPTFTRVPPTQPPPPTIAPPPPTVPPTRAPTLRPPPTRAPTPKPAAPTPVPPTPDLYGGYYYRPVFKGCVTAPDTRILGTVYDNGAKKNGVIVRLSESDGGPKFPDLDDFVTGTDPSDYKHICLACEGMYRLSPAEGQMVNGNWWVFVVDSGGSPLSKGYFIHTQDGPGCNSATVDFVHK